MEKFIVENLKEDEVRAIIRATAPERLIVPIRTNKKAYQSDARLLADMDTRKESVKFRLRNISMKKYRSGDKAFIDIIQNSINGMTEELTETLQSIIGTQQFDLGLINDYSIEDIVNLLERYFDSTNIKIEDFNWDLLWVQFKVGGVFFDEEKRKTIKQMLGIVVEEIPEVEGETIEHQPSQEPKKKKTKKKSAEEKAASNKEAVERKKKKEEELKKIEETPEESKQGKKENINDTRQLDEKKQTITSKREKELMPVYIGKISIENTFYNFTPMYKKNEIGLWSQLGEDEVNSLLKESDRGRIELSYDFISSNECDFMMRRFVDEQLVIFEFEREDLQINKYPNGIIKPSTYKVNAIEKCKIDKIRLLASENLYRVVTLDDFDDDSDIFSQKAVGLRQNDFVENEEVFVDMGDAFYAGPYPLHYLDRNNKFYISPDVVNEKYILYGYEEQDLKKLKFRDSEFKWSTQKVWDMVYLREDATWYYKDVITDDLLLKAYNDSINDGDGTLDISVPKNEDSLIYSEDIDREIRDARSQRLKEILEFEEKPDNVPNDLLDIMFKIIANNSDDERSGAIIDRIIERHPEILNKFASIRAVNDEIVKLQQVKENLNESIAKNKGLKIDTEKLNDLNKQIEEKEYKITHLSKTLNLLEDIAELTKKKESLTSECENLTKHKQTVNDETEKVERRFEEVLDNYSSKIVDISLDGFMSGKMLQTASEWNNNEKKTNFSIIAKEINKIEPEINTPEELVDYLVNTIKIERPQYDKNTILNIIICITQGFLTVFAGEPGCGKTSICNIVAKTFGLLNYDNHVIDKGLMYSTNRFVPVSVERGWTSKRDLVGYYNPLTKSFEESNREIFDGLKLLDFEAKNNMVKFPYYILLDEANLSPMEYYWADFMNVCDRTGINLNINLGNDNIYIIPENLHFVATINNDNTTEELSPRLIDRAWVITLPYGRSVGGRTIDIKDTKIVGWELLKKTFITDENIFASNDSEINGVYTKLIKLLGDNDYEISARSDLAIKNYCNAASKVMESDEIGFSAAIKAFDFAVYQKILPSLSGSGDDYEQWLDSLKTLCNRHGLYQSGTKLDKMISSGRNKNMGFYKFF